MTPGARSVGVPIVTGDGVVGALGFVVATAVIAVLVNGVEKERASVPQPAE